MNKLTPITVAKGDGIGPEIMDATLKILQQANAQIAPEFIDVGEKVYLSGNSTGIPTEAWESLKRTRVLLKAPITTPQGGGYKSLNVTIRKTLGLYANVRPCKAFYPFVKTKSPDMDLVIIRENEEGLYAGIEHRQTEESYQCLKIVTKTGCERIVRYAFDYAKKYNRNKVTCMSKDNIMKFTDGVFHKVFNEVAKEYPEIETNHYIIDIGTAELATKPEIFDVIVTSNLYGDIISDVAAQVAGSVGLAGSANVGKEFAMFEAIHGSAPDIAGKNIANPSGLLNGAIQMLIHIGQADVASNIHNAWLKTIEDGIHTGDIYTSEHSQQKVSTAEFAEAVCQRLGQQPTTYTPVAYQASEDDRNTNALPSQAKQTKVLVGIDVFVEADTKDIPNLNDTINGMDIPLKLIAITNRGLIVNPQDMGISQFSDHWCLRFQVDKDFTEVSFANVMALLNALQAKGIEFIKSENLYTFDGERGFSLAQGQ